MTARPPFAFLLWLGIVISGCQSLGPAPALNPSAPATASNSAAPSAHPVPQVAQIALFPDPPIVGQQLIVVVSGLVPGRRYSIDIPEAGDRTEQRAAVDGIARATFTLPAEPKLLQLTIVVGDGADTLVVRSTVRTALARAEPPMPAPTKASVPPVMNITVQFTERVGGPDRNAILSNVPIVAAFVRLTFGNDVARSDVIRVRSGETATAANGEILTACCNTDGNGRVAYFDVAHPHWSVVTSSAPSVAATRLHLLAHEYMHLWQAEQGQGGCLQRPGRGYVAPRWFLEGVAEFIGFRIEVAEQLATAAQIEGVRFANVRMFPVSVRQLEGDAWPMAPDTYGASYAAVVLLAESAGTSSLRTFCERVGNGDPWQGAFQHAFGVTPEAFYTRFEKWLTS